LVRTVQDEYRKIKQDLHRRILEEIDLEQMDRLKREHAIQETRKIIRTTLERDNAPLTLAEREKISQEILDELFGLGPIEPLLADPSISDILVNGFNTVYVERHGILERTSVQFHDDEHLKRIIDRIVSRVGRRVDESSPMVDARLPDGSRVNAIIPPLSLSGPILSIRRFGIDPLKASDLIANSTLTPGMLDLLQAAVHAKLNILISGGTGAGKTTLLNALSASIPEGERIITIEDAAELQLKQSHVVRLETRPANVEGKGAVRQRELVINALRMRPDRIIVGEVRGAEALDMLQAMNTGHEGSLTTIHANTPRDALARLETMVTMANLQLPDKAIRQQIASAMDMVIQIARLSDGTRKVTHISEVTGMEGPVVTMQDLFLFRRQGIDPKGRVLGQFVSQGVRPKFTEKLQAAGLELPPEIFSIEQYRELSR